jgi:hypothetical protein
MRLIPRISAAAAATPTSGLRRQRACCACCAGEVVGRAASAASERSTRCRSDGGADSAPTARFSAAFSTGSSKWGWSGAIKFAARTAYASSSAR